MFLVGWGLMCTKTLWIMYTARLLMGMAVGISLAVTSMYIGEMVDDSIRSTINCMYPVFNKFPLILTFGIGPHISYHNLIFICSVPSLAFMFLYKMLPESPLFLFLKNRDSEGIETLSWLRQLPESSVIDEAKSIKNSLSDKEEGSWANLFFRRSNLRAMMIVGSLQFFWQYSWGTVVIAYAQPILLQTGLSFSSSLCAWVMAIMTWIGASLAPVLVRSWGYKTSLMVSSTVCTLSMGTCAYFLGICLTGDNSPLVQWSVLISQILYTISNYSSYYPVSISLLGEYFEPSMKAKASTIITCVLCLESSFAVYIFPLFLRTFDLSITYWFSFAILFLGTMFVSIFIPETSGLSFAQIQEVLHR
ncbi:hypothetical protein J6590_089987 [Homalodisca vitripennis]|nr:hypothetical protein J6590_089987 [Homalodisca vitripennis]